MKPKKKEKKTREPWCTISDMVHHRPPFYPQIPPSGDFICFHVFFLFLSLLLRSLLSKLISASQFFFHLFPYLPPSTLPSLHHCGMSSLHVSLSMSLSFIGFFLPFGSALDSCRELSTDLEISPHLSS